MKNIKLFRIFTFVLLFSITFLTNIYAFDHEPYVNTNKSALIDYFSVDSGIIFSNKATLVILKNDKKQELLNDTQTAVIAIRDIINDGTVRMTIIVPYAIDDNSLISVNITEYLRRLNDYVSIESNNMTVNTRSTYVPPVTFSDMNIYLNYYYTEVNGFQYGLGGYLYRPVQLYAKMTQGSSNVTGFAARVHVWGDKYSMSPNPLYISENLNYNDNLSVATMIKGSPYSKSLNSISPYYVYTGTGAYTFAPIHELAWGGYYQGMMFSGYYAFP